MTWFNMLPGSRFINFLVKIVEDMTMCSDVRAY